ncbi:kidney mitochondrial carrier protein 1-like [Phalaenopsis equestris]|uniref:kidney mitochondrial carrier protein 1-like n=1 Tax=Phalaenopsis equestris TaxID=78828 RepID=UPI0009E5FE47|nr:kidney mitochondrial carrier protein 1-like [Phalaenopsis equestris]
MQPPGSIGKYHGVFHALQEIARQEGLQGLYRGLTPRLAMYVSQGAIFFASYEFLKAVFLLESPEDATKMKENEICLDDQAAAGLQKLPA